MPNDDKQPLCLGFLTVVDSQHGLMGGYLVLNGAGRPLEFHCTAPVKPNRAQQILYGPTLEPFLYGEQIGQALTAKSQLAPVMICTDVPPAMAVRTVVNTPVVLVLPAGEPTAVTEGGQLRLRLDDAHAAKLHLHTFEVRGNRLAVGAERIADRAEILARLDALETPLDLHEPFGRIREALDEAQRGGR
jgi:hypothetical protein